MGEQWICNEVAFFEGDRVRVMRQEEDFAQNGMGDGEKWCNTWVPADGVDGNNMDCFLGMEFVIECIDDTGVYFDTQKYGYGFPLTSLDNLSAAQRMKEAA